jgi:D-glycero-alpha-D-manno-heptose 1-phosphate guanylyltransferase
LSAIVLAGGFGTRLKDIIKDIPKPMADINGKPFLEILLRYLQKNSIKKAVLSAGYKQEKIIEYFKESFVGINIVYSKEDNPLGTGGAIKKALELIDDDNVFILNGDTFFNINLLDMKRFHLKNCADITIALKNMKNFDRYGAVALNKSRVIRFEEKKNVKSGYINGGVYILQKDILKDQKDIFSFEEYLSKTKKNIYGYKSDGYFIDIGVPEDYLKAKKDLADGYK